jgi:hypothetical protein
MKNIHWKKHFLGSTYELYSENIPIIDPEKETVIGRITYNGWMTKGRIELRGNNFDWRFNNAWNTRWSVSNTEKRNINYRCKTTRGNIEVGIDDDILALSGLYIHNYNSQITATALIVVFIPVWIAALN